MKKLLTTLAVLLALSPLSAEAVNVTVPSAPSLGSILYGKANGNYATLTVGANGDCLKLTAGIPAWGSCGSGGGGTDGNWSFFNTSGIRLATTSNQVLIGASATTSLAALEVIAQSVAKGSLLATGSTTLQNFTFLNATGTNATTTKIFSTTASSTNLFSLNATTSSLGITGIASSLLKTTATGGVVPAVSGTDYSNFGSSVGPTELQSTDFGDWTCNGTTCTLDATYLTANQTITLSGDASGSGSTAITVTVADDSHAHTGTTLSGIDISDDTNLAGDTEIVLTGDALSIASTIARDTELHNAVTLAGEDYLSLSTQQITANAIDPDNLSASDFGAFTCNGTTCSLDTTYVTSVSGTYPIVSSGGATPAISLADMATTSVTCTGDASCTPFTVIGASPITINSTGGAGGSWATTSQNYYNSQFRDWSIVNGALSPTTTLGVGVYASSTISRLTVTNGTTTNATSTNLNISGTLDIDQMTSALLLTGSTGIVAEYAGTSCTNQFVRSLSALGAATCATVANTDLANSSVSYGGVSVSLGGSDATPAFNLADATGLPISTGVSGLGTSVATALGVNVGTAGAFVVNGGALGTPSSGTLTNTTGLPIVAGTTGTLTVARGGTGLTTFGGTNTILYTTAADTLSSEAAFTYNPSTNILTLDSIQGNASSTITRLTVTNGTTTNATSTNLTVSGTLRLSVLNCSANSNGGTLTTDANGFVSCADDDSSAGGGAYPFAVAGNATTTLTQFNGGLTAYASSTIGNGTQAGGLTISGGATTTGSVKIGSGASTILFDGLTGSATTTQATTTSLYVSGLASTTNLRINGYVQSAKIDTAFIFATSTLGTGTTTLKLAGFKQPTSFISFGCSSTGGGTFTAQLGDSNASSTMITSSTGLTTTYTALTSNNAFTTGETVWFSIGNVSGTVTNPTCSYQRVVTTSD